MNVSSRRAKSNAVERARWARKYFRSGLSQGEFAVQHGLRLSTLQRWVAQNRQTSGGDGGESLGQRTLSGPPAVEAAAFAEVKLGRLAAPRWTAEVVHADGSVLRLANDIAPALLDQLLGVC